MTSQLDPGDALVVFTDGVLGIFDGSLTALDEIARLSESAPSSEALVDVLSTMVDPDGLDDDVTIIVVRRLPN